MNSDLWEDYKKLKEERDEKFEFRKKWDYNEHTVIESKNNVKIAQTEIDFSKNKNLDNKNQALIKNKFSKFNLS